MSTPTVQETLNYYAKQLIIQYNGLPKASSTIECLANCSVCDGIIYQLQTTFSLNVAVGAQLTILGKIVGVPRNIYGLDLSSNFFTFSNWSGLPASIGFNSWTTPVDPDFIDTWQTTAVYTPTDFEMLALIQLKIMANNYYTSLSLISNALYNIFGNDITIQDLSVNGGIDSFTQLMLQLNNNVTDTSQNSLTGTNHSVTFQNTTYPYSAQIYTGSFNGTSSYLSIPNSSIFNMGTTSFTVEAWVYMTTISSIQTIMGWASSTGPVQFDITPTNLEIYAETGFVIQVSFTPVVNTWYLITYQRSGTTWKIFVNGQQIGASVIDGRTLHLPNNANGITIGAECTGPSQFFKGYMAGVRVQKGIADYQTNFIPSPVPYAVAEREIVYNFSNPYHNVGTVCQFLEDIVPKPMGVAISYNNI